jgi:hypothetical protein
MLVRNGERPATDCTVNGALKTSGIGNARTSKPNTNKSQDPIRAELFGSNTCTAGNLTAHGHAPVLVLCRQLIAAGLEPDRAMEVFRGATLALRVRSIGAAARLTVKERPFGPTFEKWVPFSTPPVSPTIAPSEQAGGISTPNAAPGVSS